MPSDAPETGSLDAPGHSRHVIRTCLPVFSRGGSHACTTSDRCRSLVCRGLSQFEHQRLAESSELRSKYDDLSHVGNRYGIQRHPEGHADGNQYRNGDNHWHWYHRQHRHWYDNEPTAHDDAADESAAASLRSQTKGRRPARLSPRGSLRLFVLPVSGASLDCSTTCDQAHQDDYDGNHEKQVDQAARDVKHAEAEDPQDEENYRKCPKHCRSPRSWVSRTL
jgi:hypothetical protein